MGISWMSQEMQTVTAMDGSRIDVSHDLKDKLWDDFVLNTPGGNYRQSSLWAQAQLIRGWNPMRIMVKRDDEIQTGAQILIRKLPFFGQMGYLSRGPVCDFTNIGLCKSLIIEIEKIRRQEKITYLVLTLPENGGPIVPSLYELGYRKTRRQYGEPASIRIDLTQDLQTITLGMGKTKRKIIHRIERGEGLPVREGTRADVTTFYRLHSMASRRIGFPAHSEEYYQNFWDVFEPQGNAKLFIAEKEAEPVCAMLTILFRDTVNCYVLGWSGEFSKYYPNDSVLWEIMRWAKSAGYHFFDLVGMGKNCARSVQGDENISKKDINSYQLFKIEFGGEAYAYPDDLDHVNIPFLNTMYRILSFFMDKSGISRLLSLYFRWKTDHRG